MSTEYDFIVVGGGPSGCVIASRLAQAPGKPSVLLVEAGGPNDSPEHLAAAERFNIAFNPKFKLNWGYKTEPQLGKHRIDYSRGKGLGGSTAINFCMWTVAPQGDWDEWARRTGDDSFNWKNARKHLNEVERIDVDIPVPKLKKYIDADPKKHGTKGHVDVTYNKDEPWLSDLENMFVAAEQAGLPMNVDTTSGTPIGFGMPLVCIKDGLRVTSASAYLTNPPSNLKIETWAQVHRLLFDGKAAVGVETIDGRQFRASKEVILATGTLNTPQVLMLSGVGPRDELEKHGIAVVNELPHVGKNLQDHVYSSIGVVLTCKEDTPPQDQPQAPNPIGWFKSKKALASPEFEKLPEETKRYLSLDTTPDFELLTYTPPRNLNYEPRDNFYYIGSNCALLNEQSRGTVTLRSSDPKDAPIFDPCFLTHPYDRVALIDAVRHSMSILTAPIFKDRVSELLGPKDDSDEAIWAHIETNLHSLWHMSCTARMGKSAEDGCVDSRFRVFGTERLRIADMSVAVLVPSTHTMSTAYVIGEMAAEKIIADHGLDKA